MGQTAYFILFICMICYVCPENATKESLKDRINFNVNRGQAQAVGPDGSSSKSQGYSGGYNVGILSPWGHYRPLGGQTFANAQSQTAGKRPPTTFVNTGVTSKNGGIIGHINTGFSGGKGTADAYSNSQTVAIPLGPSGGVLLSNLQKSKKVTEAA